MRSKPLNRWLGFTSPAVQVIPGPLSTDGDGIASRGGCCCVCCVLLLLLILSLGVVGTRLALKEAALLDGAASLDAGDGAVVGVLGNAARRRSGAASVDVVGGRREVGDVLGDGVLGAYGAGVDTVALAGLGHGIVARVEVLALLEMFGKVIGAGRQLAVETEETLFLRGEGLFPLSVFCLKYF